MDRQQPLSLYQDSKCTPYRQTTVNPLIYIVRVQRAKAVNIGSELMNLFYSGSMRHSLHFHSLPNTQLDAITNQSNNPKTATHFRETSIWNSVCRTQVHVSKSFAPSHKRRTANNALAALLLAQRLDVVSSLPINSPIRVPQHKYASPNRIQCSADAWKLDNSKRVPVGLYPSKGNQTSYGHAHTELISARPK